MQKHSQQHSNKSTLIHTDHLSLTYGETKVFSDVCISVDRGSFSSIVGPNGAGKTQLMRVMLGLVKPTDGVIKRNYKMSDVGYVPQKLFIDPSFPITVREFLITYLSPKGFWISNEMPKFDKNLMVEDLIDKQVGKLSGGQLQRVMLSAVLSTKPKILFLDEFSSGVDPHGRSELFNQLHRLNEVDKISIIMISHDIEVTSQYADTVFCLNKEMVCNGRPHEVFTAENFEKMYGIPLTKLKQHEHRNG
ncbi:MAG: metal ABC transporter ATP-binding protein [bacterium]|nr:metal ABC transporter ATP-binding protein [bacterium]